MVSKSQYFFPALCRIGLSVLFLLLVLPGAANASKIAIAATVNDQVITTNDLAERRDLVMATSGIPATPENIQRITPHILQSLIDEALQMQEAKRQSITVTDAELSKAVDSASLNHNQPAGSLKHEIESQGLSLHSFENQLRAQLAWSKVVQRKLRRNVSVSKDELVRAEQVDAAGPGISEWQITALIVPLVADEKKMPKVKALVHEIGAALDAGKTVTDLTPTYSGRTDVQVNPPVWVIEENLPPEVREATHDLKPGMTSAPVRVGNSIQFVELMERRVTKKSASATEVSIKQIAIDVPAKSDKAMQSKLEETERQLRTDPGSCENDLVPKTPLSTEVKFARLTMGSLALEQRSVLSRLEVGQVSEPLPSPNRVTLLLLCERSEPAAGNAQENEQLRQQLFSEKMELEAQKHLRNLRRDAAIDIRTPGE